MIIYDRFFALIKQKGISVYSLLRDGATTPGAAHRMRKNEGITSKTIDSLCKALDCQPGDLMEYVPDDNQ